MLELTLRDGMVIVGSLLIFAVIIDALRRMRQQSRERVRMRLATDIGDGEILDDIGSFRELPNGGARVIDRDDLLGRIQEERDKVSAANRDQVTDGTAEPLDESPSAFTDSSAVDSLEASRGYGEETGEADAVGPLTGVSAAPDEPANLDWLDDLPAQGETDANEAEAGELPRNAETEVIVLHVSARDESGFRGADILEILLACDLRFGDMSFFHRHEYEAGRGAIQFSVANMLQPGVFDIDNMDAMQTRGLVFFVTLPGPENMLQAFDYMLETARAVAKNLNGELLDESRSVLTQQSVEHSRQQIRELERRLLARGW